MTIITPGIPPTAQINIDTQLISTEKPMLSIPNTKFEIKSSIKPTMEFTIRYFATFRK